MINGSNPMGELIPCVDRVPRRQSWAHFAFAALFLACVVGVWVWFHPELAGDAASKSRAFSYLQISVETNLPGFDYVAQPLEQSELETLSTTNIVNGLFQAQGSRAVPGVLRDSGFRVFFATWQANSGQGLAVVQHTPDICWIGAGWKPVDLGQPKQITLSFPLGLPASKAVNAPESTAIQLPFECRVFQSPGGKTRELVIWCTLVGGQVLSESGVFNEVFKQRNADSAFPQIRQGAPARRLSAGYFWEAVRQRRATRGIKQFVRLSSTLTGDYPATIKDLQASAIHLLRLSN